MVAEQMKRTILRVQGYKRTQINMMGWLGTLELELSNIMLSETKRLRVGVAIEKEKTAVFTAKLGGIECIELMMLDDDESLAN